MSGLVGRGSRSFKKKIVEQSLIPALGIKKVRFAHRAPAGIMPNADGDITISFATFIAPPEMVAEGFSNPSSTEITNLRVGQFRNNVRLESNLNGVLIDQITYTITDSSFTLMDNYVVTAGEIFVFTVGSNPVTGNRIVDARPLRASGGRDGENMFADISARPIDFSVGQGFRVAGSTVNSAGEDNQQIGNVQVFVNGVLQIRNDGNSVTETTMPASDQSGNYAEVALTSTGTLIAGVDYANAIRFNQFNNYNLDDGVLVVATNLIVDEPNGTGILSITENNSTNIAANTAASAANTSRSTANTNELATIPTVPGNLTDATDYTLQVPANTGAAVWAASGGGGGNNLFQRRNLSTSLFANTSDIASLRFANLTSGRIYRVTMQADFSFAALDSTVDLELRAIHNGNTLCSVRGGSLANGATVGVDGHLYVGTSVIFTASATTCTFSFFEHIDQGDLLTANTFTQLEELNNYSVTTQF